MGNFAKLSLIFHSDGARKRVSGDFFCNQKQIFEVTTVYSK